MRVLQLSGWSEMAVLEVPDVQPRGDEVLIRVLATGICGSDIHGFTGENGRRELGQVMGHESVGEVAGYGPDAQADLPLGSIVTFNPVISCGACEQCVNFQDQLCATRTVIGVAASYQASFADYLVVPERNLVPFDVPANVRGVGALVEPLAVGFNAARKGNVTEGDTVLVIGGGPIGQACALAAVRLGATNVVVSEPVASRRALLARLGIQSVDARSADAMEQVLVLLGKRPSVVIDAVGNEATVGTAFEVSALGARIVLVGMGQPNALAIPAYELSTKQRALLGSFCYSREEFSETAAWAAANAPLLQSLIEDVVSAEGAQDAFLSLAKGTNPASKVLVAFGPVASAE